MKDEKKSINQTSFDEICDDNIKDILQFLQSKEMLILKKVNTRVSQLTWEKQLDSKIQKIMKGDDEVNLFFSESTLDLKEILKDDYIVELLKNRQLNVQQLLNLDQAKCTRLLESKSLINADAVSVSKIIALDSLTYSLLNDEKERILEKKVTYSENSLEDDLLKNLNKNTQKSSTQSSSSTVKAKTADNPLFFFNNKRDFNSFTKNSSSEINLQNEENDDQAPEKKQRFTK